jgi:hypothetical protein
MQAPAGTVDPVEAPRTVTTGLSYTPDANGQILAYAQDVGILLGLGFTLLASPTAVSLDDTITAYTLSVSDLNRKLAFNAATTVTLTVPDDLVASDENADVVIQQIGAGTVTPSGSDIRNRQSHTGTAGQYAQIVLSKIPGTDNGWLMAGDTA